MEELWKKIILKDEIFIGELEVFFAESESDFKKCINRQLKNNTKSVDKVIKHFGNDLGLCKTTGTHSIIIRIDLLKDKPKVDPISTICHEINHEVTRIVTLRGIKDDETRAYLTGWMSSIIIRFYLKNFESGERT